MASLCFNLSGIHSDLLIIRFFLFVAYVMLFINAVMGSPLWPNVTNAGYLPLDSLFWSVAGLYVHGVSLLNLILDERHVELSEDEAALWRMFYRTGGLSARLYKNIVSPYVRVVTFNPGEDIPVEDFFYILYMGDIHLRVYEGEELKTERETMHSGDMFDMKYLGMFADDHFFLDHSIACTSKTSSTLFCFSRADMKKIAQHHLVKSVWQSLLINNLSALLEKYMEKQANYSNDPEDTDRIFGPLEDWELPKPHVAGSGSAVKYIWHHFWNSLYRQFSPPWPFGKHLSGIRQTGLSAPVNSPSCDPDRVPPMHGSSRTLIGELKSTSGKSDDYGPDEEETADV